MSRVPLGVKRGLLKLACALMLVAQHAGLAHAVWHSYRHLPTAKQTTVSSDRSERKQTPKLSKLCAFDALFGQVLGAAASPSQSQLTAAPVDAMVPFPDCTVQRAEFLAPLSRGPPSFL